MDETRTPSGLGFFPSCDGVWDGPKNPAHKRLLLVGQDFGSEARLRLSGETRATPTWSHLDALLKVAKVDTDLCFFTNAVMGARKAKSTGPSPAFKLSPPFIVKCGAFLIQQVAVVNPDAIVILGLQGLPVWQKITKPFPTATRFSSWDKQTNRQAIRVTIGAWTGNLILLAHPCYRPANLHLSLHCGAPNYRVRRRL